MIVQAAKIIGSGLATIGLAGAGVGILRLNNYSRNNINFKGKCHLFVKFKIFFCRQSKANRLFKEAEYNEILSKGLMSNQMESIAIYKRCSEDIAVIESIAKAKYCYKKGSTPRYVLLVYNTINICLNEKVINLYLNYTIDSQDYSFTDTCFTITHNLIVYPTIIKSGNLGQIFSNVIEIKGISNKTKDIEDLSIYKRIKKSVCYKYLELSMTNIEQAHKQVIYYRYGGKINEKAKASVKADDIVKIYSSLRYIRLQLIRFNGDIRRQNSLLFKIDKVNYSRLNIVRHYSTQVDKSMYKCYIPTGLTQIELESKVFNEQRNLAYLAKKYGVKHRKVQRKIEVLIRSKSFREYAVTNVSNNPGSKTPGIDGFILQNKEQIYKMAEDLLDLLKKYKANPLKRVYIPKKEGKVRPLGIPTIRDRCLQELVKTVLEPLVEINSDKNSYGYRKFRSAKNAIGTLRAELKSNSYQEGKWILDADIEGFFDNINHDWLLKNIPLPKQLKKIIKEWLKCGVIYKGQFSETLSGTPQGGIISPVLANMTLNGLEKVVEDSILPITISKAKRYTIRDKEGKVRWYNLGIKCIRYADDFVILARSKHVINNYIKPKVMEFLKERGLHLNGVKTKVFAIKKQELNYLGFTFKYRDDWKIKYAMIKERLGQKEGIALYPTKSNLYRAMKKVRQIIEISQNATAYELISNLNPVIRGWCSYYNIGNSSRFKGRLRQFTYRRLIKWAINKHRRWGIKRIVKKYFLGDENFKGRKWNFHGKTLNNSRYTDSEEGKIIYLLDPYDFPVIAANCYNLPNILKEIQSYDIEYLKLIEYNVNNQIRSMGKYGSNKEKLFKKQKGICPLCEKMIDFENIHSKDLHIDHIIPISKQGSKRLLSNMRLVHKICHILHHKSVSSNKI